MTRSMLCEHLTALENALLTSHAVEVERGRVWSKNCREWVYFDVVLDLDALRERFAFDACVRVHENLDPRSGLERGFVCSVCHDGVMGRTDGGKTYA